jgi:putative membrane protein
MEAGQGGMAEVELGKLAEQRGSIDAVKDFGRRMAADHGKASEELTQLARQKGLTLPTKLDSKHQSLYDRLAKLSGAEFDRACITEMVKDHRKDAAEFKKLADQGRDAELKAWARKTLPTIEDHLQTVENLSTQVKSSSKSSSKSK